MPGAEVCARMSISDLTIRFAQVRIRDDTMEEMLKLLAQSTSFQVETNRALVEEQRKANRLKEEELELQRRQHQDARPLNLNPGLRASDFIPKMGPTDDPEAYLHAFENTATREKWPKDQWVGILAPFLSGESQKAFQDLDSTTANDYDVLKEEILSRIGLTKFGMAQRFHNWGFRNDQPPRAQMHELIRITKKWLDPSKTSAAAIVEAVVVDRYLRALPYEAKKVVSQSTPVTAGALVEAVEQYQATNEMLRMGKKEQPMSQGRHVNPYPQPERPPSSNAGRQINIQGRYQTDWGQRKQIPERDAQRCYRCGEVGPISRQCNKGDEPMPTAESASSQPTHLYASLMEGSEHQAFTCPVKINKQDVEALLDSGSNYTLVHKPLMEGTDWHQEGTRPVACVHGDTRQYPTCTVKLITTQGQCEVKAGVLDSLPVSLLIGRDCPLFLKLWREIQERRSKQAGQPRGEIKLKCRPKKVPGTRLTLASSPVNVFLGAADSASEVGPASESEEEPQGSHQPSSSEEDRQRAADGPPPLTGQYGTAQLNDPTLINALRSVRVIEGVDQDRGGSLTYPHFAVKNGLL